MITKVRTRYFKQFTEQEFDLAEHVILAGPNNSGKTTLLQAITVWCLALQKQVHDLLRSIASRRRCQLVIATHSEVLIDGTNPGQIVSFHLPG